MKNYFYFTGKKSEIKKYGILFYGMFFLNNLASEFSFTFEPIDAVVPCHEKDKITIDLVVKGIRENVKNIRRIIVVSAKPFTDKAEWFDERNFPFTKETVAYEIFNDRQKASEFMRSPKTRIGWIYQQFLKVYSVFVIPDISSNVLIVDADTIFLKPVEFQDPITGAGLYNPGRENTLEYFEHLACVFPDFRKVFPEYSGISHHMLFQRSVMEAIFEEIYRIHNKEPWKVYCEMIDKKNLYTSCMCVEYELYFNFVFARSNLVKIRHLKRTDIPFSEFNQKKRLGYDYLSCHSWLG